jgi:hypothetical protein
LDGLPACGSEECIALLTDLIRDEEIEQERAHSFLTTIALIPHPSPHTVGSVNVRRSEGTFCGDIDFGSNKNRGLDTVPILLS